MTIESLKHLKFYLFVACVLASLAKAEPTFADNGALIRPNGYSLENPAPGTPVSDLSPGNSQQRLTESPRSNEDSLSIPLRKSTNDSEATRSTGGLSGLSGSLGTTIGALIVTLGLFAALAVALKRFQKHQQPKSLPREAFEVIGETEIGPKQKLMVVRCGVQALVIGVSPAGIQNVAQIDDPDEAGQFIAQCRGLGSTAVFNSTLRELEKEPTTPGFVGQETNERMKGKLFLRA